MSGLGTPKEMWLRRTPGRECPRFRPTRQIDERWVQWLDSLAPWTHAYTVTCKRRGVRNSLVTEDILVDTARHFIRRVSLRCYGKRARRERLIPVVATLGWGTYEDHPHLHFCFASPEGVRFRAFNSILDEEADKTFWIDRQRCIKRYRDTGWLSYLIEHGTAHLIVPLITPSSSASSR
jgi:hypothetical protein